MSMLLNSKGYNPKDYYLLIFTDTEEIYDSFRTKWGADSVRVKSPLKEWLKTIINPKYTKNE